MLNKLKLLTWLTLFFLLLRRSGSRDFLRFFSFFTRLSSSDERLSRERLLKWVWFEISELLEQKTDRCFRCFRSGERESSRDWDLVWEIELISYSYVKRLDLPLSSQIGHGRHHDLLMLILSPVRVLDHADLICTVRVILNDDRGTWSVCHVTGGGC